MFFSASSILDNINSNCLYASVVEKLSSDLVKSDFNFDLAEYKLLGEDSERYASAR